MLFIISRALQHIPHSLVAWRKMLQVTSKESLPSDEDLAKEVVSVLSGVNVLEFNIKMLMKHLSKHCHTLFVRTCHVLVL